MKALNICIGIILIATIIVATAYFFKCTSINRELEDVNAELQNTRNLLENSRAECTILKETAARDRSALEQYSRSIEATQTEYIQKHEIIHNDKTAADWLATPLPDSMRLLYGCTCDHD